MNKTVAYYRNSIKKEKQKLSIEMQMHHVQEIAKKQLLLIDDEFIDRETSARKTQVEQRNGMKLLMEEIKKGRIKNLIVYSRCRLARNVQQYMSLFDLLRQYQVNVIFAAEFEFPMTYTMESELVERILAAINQADAEKLVQKLQDAKITKARGGKHAAGAIPFGFRKPLQDETSSKNEERESKKEEWEKIGIECEVIESIYELFLLDNSNSLQKFVNKVNKKGLKYRGEKDWEYNSMRKLLTNPIYKGERSFNTKDESIIRKVEEIRVVRDSTWEKVQAKMKEVVKAREKDQDEVELVYLLNDLVYCSECSVLMRGKKHVAKAGTTFVYKCKVHSKIRVEKNWLEETVIKYANQFFEEIVESNFSEIVDQVFNGEVSFYLESMKEIEGEIKHWEDKMVERTELSIEKSGELSIDSTMLEAIKKYEQLQFLFSEMGYRIEEIKEKFNTITDWKKDSVVQLLSMEMDDQDKIELIHDIVFKIDVGQDHLRIVFQHPLFTGIKGSAEIGFS